MENTKLVVTCEGGVVTGVALSTDLIDFLKLHNLEVEVQVHDYDEGNIEDSYQDVDFIY